MIFQSDDYARSLEELTESELRSEELRVYSMLEYDMGKREEDRDGWHGFACESAKKLLLVRWALEHLGMEPTLFGCECGDEVSSEEVEDVVLIAA